MYYSFETQKDFQWKTIQAVYSIHLREDAIMFKSSVNNILCKKKKKPLDIC